MAVKYYPLSRILPNLYTRGGEFFAPNGKPYTGRYYVTYEGKAYSGINPVVGTNNLLTPYPPAQNNGARRAVQSTAANVTQDLSLQNTQDLQGQSDLELNELVPYFPTPIESDYSRGYFIRYFAKNVTGPGYVVEISQNDWSKIQDGDVSPTILAYETTDLLWQIAGPLHDSRVPQYQIVGGVYDTNKRVTEAKAKGFIGLISFIGGDYTKFAKITL